MKITIYHNPRCSKSRQTLQLLQKKADGKKAINIQIVEYLKEPPSAEELAELLKKLKMKPLDLIRKKEDIFKEKYKGKDLSDEEWIQVMIKNPKLIERPIVVAGRSAVLGRPPENIEKLF